MNIKSLTVVTFAALLGLSSASYAACDATSAGNNTTTTECNADNSTNIDASTNVDNSTNIDSSTVDNSSTSYGGDHIENPKVVNINKGMMVQQQVVKP